MDDATRAAYINAGAQVLGQGINTLAISSANRKNRKYADAVYARQRADNLADWQRMNEYNHPAQQMQRLKEAGLNPNMVYGSGATTQAAPIRSADAPRMDYKAPQVELGGIAQGFYDVQLKRLQTDNLKEAILTAQKQQNLIEANTLKSLTDIDLKKFDLDKGKQMLGMQLDALKLGLEKTMAETKNIGATTESTLQGMQISREQLQLNKEANQRAWKEINTMLKPRLDEIMQRIYTSRLQNTKIPFEREILEKQSKTFMESFNMQMLTQAQQRETGKILQEGALLENLLKGESITSKRIQNEVEKTKQEFRKLGLSETVVQDIFQQILGFASPQYYKGKQVN